MTSKTKPRKDTAGNTSRTSGSDRKMARLVLVHNGFDSYPVEVLEAKNDEDAIAQAVVKYDDVAGGNMKVTVYRLSANSPITEYTFKQETVTVPVKGETR